jgi:hypothetical protein
MRHYLSERHARRARQKALYITIFFHLLLLGSLAYYSSGADWRELLPQSLQVSLGIEAPAQDVASQRETIRP